MGHAARRAAIFVQRGALDRKQEEACLSYGLSQQWTMLSIVPFWAPEDAVSLVREGTVSIVVVAFDSPVVQQLAGEIGDAGRVVAVHPEPHVIRPPRRGLPMVLVDLVVKWFRRGRSVKEIAVEIDQDTTDVRAALRRAGEHPDRSG